MKMAASLLCAVLIVTSACKKDDEEETASKTTLLTQQAWAHQHNMFDKNNNLQPDDDPGKQEDITFKFNGDGTLDYTKNQQAWQLEWNFVDNETAIKIIGVLDSNIIPYLEESTHRIHRLNEQDLILFYESTTDNPEVAAFEIYRKM